jgi:hypothetical protein
MKKGRSTRTELRNGTARADGAKSKGKDGSNENDTTRTTARRENYRKTSTSQVTPQPRQDNSKSQTPNELDESTAVKTYLSENIDGDEVLTKLNCFFHAPHGPSLHNKTR